jgi:type IV secretion system pilin
VSKIIQKIMKSFTKTILITSFLVLIILSPFAVKAAACEGIGCVTAGMDVSANKAGLDTGNDAKEISGIIGRAINYMFGVLGIVFLTIVLVGGFQWMTAGGNEEKVGKAKKFIVNGINGMIVIFLAYALVFTIMAALGAATS